MSEYCVYCHTFPNGKKYIGITKTNVERRWNNGHGYDAQPKMQRAIMKYGWENVKHETLAIGLTQEIANQLEQYYIAKYDTIRNGYNATIGGDNIKTCYLDAYLLDMIRYVKYHSKDFEETGAFIVDQDKFDKESAGFWNEACRAIQIKCGKFSSTDMIDVRNFWGEVDKYCKIYNKMCDWG